MLCISLYLTSWYVEEVKACMHIPHRGESVRKWQLLLEVMGLTIRMYRTVQKALP